MFRRFFDTTTGSRVLRTGTLVAAAAASVATFAGASDWEVHRQIENAATTTLDATTPIWSDDFKVTGSGTGTTRLGFDGAVELHTNATVQTPIQVRVRFVPIGTAPADEAMLTVGSRTVFTAVRSEIACESRANCAAEGTFEVEILNPTDLGGATVDLHWVSTGSLFGRGEAAPADAIMALTQP